MCLHEVKTIVNRHWILLTSNSNAQLIRSNVKKSSNMSQFCIDWCMYVCTRLEKKKKRLEQAFNRFKIDRKTVFGVMHVESLVDGEKWSVLSQFHQIRQEKNALWIFGVKADQMKVHVWFDSFGKRKKIKFYIGREVRTTKNICSKVYYCFCLIHKSNFS